MRPTKSNKVRVNYRKILTLYGLTVIITILLGFGTGEFVVRLFVTPNSLPAPPVARTIDPYEPNPYMMFGRPYIHFFIPDSRYTAERSSYSIEYNINSAGFRGPEVSMRKTQGSKRLLIIGDSIVEGHGVPFDKTFASQLGDTLRFRGWEVVNVGLQGGSPIYYAANLPRYLAFKPDAVLLVIFENDLFDDRMQESNYFSLPLLDNEDSLISDKEGILAGSRLITFLQRAWHKHTRSPLEKIIRENRAIDTSSQEQAALVELSPFLVAPSAFDQQWAMSEKYLDYLVHSLQQRRIKVLVTVFSQGGLHPRHPEPYAVHARMLERKTRHWAESRNLPFLSLFPVTTAAFERNPPNDVMIENDGHPTEKMHHLLASFMKPWLLENLEQSKHDTVARP